VTSMTSYLYYITDIYEYTSFQHDVKLTWICKLVAD